MILNFADSLVLNFSSLSCSDTHYPIQNVSLLAMLRFLMDQNHLTQSGIPEIGTQGVVSEVMSGKRDLNVRQIKALSERFHVPPSAFV